VGDSAVEALGVGAVAPGDGIIKLGSSANVDVITSAPQPSLQTITYPYVVSGLGFTVTATNSGAASWKWFREQMIAPSGTKLRDVDLLTLAESIAPGAEGLLFHPYLMGERAPYWDPELRASFVGISARHSLGHFARAVLEGVAFSLRDCLETIEGLGTRVDRCTLLGGGSSSPLWNQIISDVTGLPLRRPAVADASLGAALLAGRAIGVFPDWKSAVATVPPTGAPIDPDDSRHALYSKIFEVYRQSAGLQRQTNARLREALASPNSDDRQSEPTRCGTLASST
jgi:xylulokinase